MAKRYISVDAGKFATKVAEYDVKSKTIRKFSVRTKVSEGDFRDDAIENQTVVISYDGKTYKVGNGARGMGANLDTNKMDDIHKICTLTALATVASANEVDELCVAIGLPAKDWAVVSKRMDYKEFMLPEGEIKMSIKKSSSSPVIEKTFKIVGRYVYPESIGALFMDDTIEDITSTTITGVLDLGNLNLNSTLWQGTEPLIDRSATSELGGAILVEELSQELSTNITRCDDLITATIIHDQKEDRQLPQNPALSNEQIEESKILIKNVLLNHAKKVKQQLKAKGWSLDVTKLIAIGGTSADIERELMEVFEGNITVLADSQYCNCLGYLRIMCSQSENLDEIIPLKEKEKSEKAEKAA